jgi:hypothetical protein
MPQSNSQRHDWTDLDQALVCISKISQRVMRRICKGQQSIFPTPPGQLRYKFHCNLEIMAVWFRCVVLSALLACAPTFQVRSQVIANGGDKSPVCTQPWIADDHQWLIFFPEHSAALSARARTVLDELAEWVHGAVPFIVVRAAADATETTAEDSDLIVRRATAVRDYLMEAGVSPHSVLVDTAGSPGRLVPNRPGVAEPQNRFVEFLLPLGRDPAGLSRDRRACFDWMHENCLQGGPAGRVSCEAALRWLAYH